ncbi:MAG: sigma-54 dependent transcriptional regulator [Proteobacteria bacterium]|nr:sigma-54 dependent transcriptional regulator [Pseudomonadota bacterium]
MAKHILVVDDEQAILQSLGGSLADEGYQVSTAASGTEALAQAAENQPDLVLLDIWMPGLDGIETLTRLKAEYPHLPVIMISGHGTIETAVQATRLGAFDFIEKPLSLDKILVTIDNALKIHDLAEEVTLLKTQAVKVPEITGHAALIRELKKQIDIVAPTDAFVLITGENGTGKELVAHAIHRHSRRRDKPLVVVNCAAIPEELIESELFGHEKGAFTGASKQRRGRFDLAHQGTIFLDEIGDMSLKTQAKVLRILEEQKFERVGGSRTIKVDVRVLAATNKDLEAEIKRDNFREDLYFRLNVIPIHVPPLRERAEDIPDLVGEFLENFSRRTAGPHKRITDEALAALQTYAWPGNVRELKNLIERLAILTPSPSIGPENLPAHLAADGDASDRLSPVLAKPYKEAKTEFERAYLAAKLEQHGGNVSLTASNIGMERSHLHRKIRTLKIAVPKKGDGDSLPPDKKRRKATGARKRRSKK